jgi:hypothetical protein
MFISVFVDTTFENSKNEFWDKPGMTKRRILRCQE